MAAPIGQQHNPVDDDLDNIPEGPPAEVAGGLDISAQALAKAALKMTANQSISHHVERSAEASKTYVEIKSPEGAESIKAVIDISAIGVTASAQYAASKIIDKIFQKQNPEADN